MYSIKKHDRQLLWQDVVNFGGDQLQQQIIQYCMGYEDLPQISDRMGTKIYYTNNLRKDTTAGCWYERKDNGLIVLADFAALEYNGMSCFDMLIAKSKDDVRPIRSFSECLRIVNEKWGLDLSGGDRTEIIQKIHTATKKPKAQRDLPDIRAEIEFNVRGNKNNPQFSDEAVRYWNRFGINPYEEYKRSIENPGEVIMYEVRNFRIRRSEPWRYYSPPGLCFAFYFPKTSHAKIYQPYNQFSKWRSNCTKADIFGLSSLSRAEVDGDPVIVTKSWKDQTVLRNLGYAAVALQNEGCNPGEKFFQYLHVLGYEPVILFDNDEAGETNSLRLSDKYEIARARIPKSTNCKDIAELHDEYGPHRTQTLVIESLEKAGFTILPF